MTAQVSAARARAARISVILLFVPNGAIAASVLKRLPAIRESLGLTLGVALVIPLLAAVVIALAAHPLTGGAARRSPVPDAMAA